MSTCFSVVRPHKQIRLNKSEIRLNELRIRFNELLIRLNKFEIRFNELRIRLTNLKFVKYIYTRSLVGHRTLGIYPGIFPQPTHIPEFFYS